MTQTVKLAKLKRSEKNVRTTPPKNVEAMAASIRARGIMQNLLVTAARPKGMFEIIAGDRRYLGAMMLAEAGEIVVFSWVVWPDKATADAAEGKMMSDPRMEQLPMPFDGKRMIYGGFQTIFEA